MPNKEAVFTIIGIALQYSLLGLIYYFLSKVIKIIYMDLNRPEARSSFLGNQPDKPNPYKRAELVIIDSGHIKLAQQKFFLDDMTYIGRSEQNGIIIEDSFISHEHASISKGQQGYWLADLNSTNKTYLNGQPIYEATLLKNGDLIKIGAVTFSFKG